MEKYETEAGRREDLEGIEVNEPIGYIGNLILPVLNVQEKTGTIYYKTVTADSAAQTGRSSGTAPTQTLLTDSSTTFSCAEAIKRYGVDKAEVKQMGGIAAADKLGAMASKRSVMRAIEEAVADAVLLNASATVDDIEASLITTVQTGLNAIRRYAGKTAFVCSYTVFNRIMAFTEIVNRFSLSSAAVSGVDALSIVARDKKALKLLLAGILQVDEVLVGDDDQWYTSDAAKQDRAALVKLPPPEEFSHKLDPVFGRNVMYLPDGKQPFEIESFYDANDKINKYDATAWYQLKVLNTGALYILDGIDAGNTVTTTTGA